MKPNRQRDSRHKWLMVWDDGRTFNGGRSGGDGGYGGEGIVTDLALVAEVIRCDL